MTDGAYKLVMARTRAGLALRQQVIRVMLRVPPARRRIAGLLSGLDIRYRRPAGAHPWVGRRMPDLTGRGGERVYEALRAGRFVLVGDVDQPTVAGWSDRVVALDCAPQEKMPGILLVRPDGYVDWAADEATATEVHAALRERCGPELRTTARKEPDAAVQRRAPRPPGRRRDRGARERRSAGPHPPRGRRAGERAPGTTSRYFRTREALMAAIVERVRALHFADLRRAPRGAVDAARSPTTSPRWCTPPSPQPGAAPRHRRAVPRSHPPPGAPRGHGRHPHRADPAHARHPQARPVWT